MSEEGGRPISIIFILHKGLSQLVTMVTFFCSLSLLFPRTDHPPQKYAQWRDKSSDFRSTLAACFSGFFQVTGWILHQHNNCSLIVWIHTRTKVYFTSFKFYMQFWKAWFATFSKHQKQGIFKLLFLQGPEDTNIKLIVSDLPYIGKCFRLVLKLVQRI